MLSVQTIEEAIQQLPKVNLAALRDCLSKAGSQCA